VPGLSVRGEWVKGSINMRGEVGRGGDSEGFEG
jgi:hypothetical protein